MCVDVRDTARRLRPRDLSLAADSFRSRTRNEDGPGIEFTGIVVAIPVEKPECRVYTL